MTSERKFIEENVKRVLLKEFLKQKTERSGFGGLDIQRTPMGTRVTLIAERPGMVIGRKGETIKELTEIVENEFKFDNPQIEVKEVSNPNLNPHIMAQKLANALERGWHFRRAGHSTVRRIMNAGAKGCQVIISGKLTGQRHRTEKFREGHIKYCGETKLNWMLEGYAVAKKKLGVIGVKVQIMDPNAKLPDEIEFHELKDVAEIKTESVEKEVEIKEITETDEEIVDKAEPEAEVTEPEPEIDEESKDDGSEEEAEKESKKKKTEKKPQKKKSEKEPKDLEKPDESSEDKDESEEQKDTKDEIVEETKEESKEEIPEENVEDTKQESAPEPESITESEKEPEPIPDKEIADEQDSEPEPKSESNNESNSENEQEQDSENTIPEKDTKIDEEEANKD
jgi:small subunit ribosomal protein S3